MPPGTPATILLVDDEEAVLRTAERVLTRAGYRVLAVSTGPAALELARTSQERIDALVTDVEMPGMSGPELVEAIGAHRPGLAVLFLSGYSSDEVLQEVVRGMEVPFLQKPFTMEELTVKIRQVLEAA